MKKFKSYSFEFLSIFIAVVSAFALNNWNDNRRENTAESKILTEIRNGLDKDREDVQLNITGHESGLTACNYWLRVLQGERVNTDSLQFAYFYLTRDYVSIQNTSGYETLKSRGFELIDNDALRTQIISLYEYDYQTLEKLEEQYSEAQFHAQYFNPFNEQIAPAFQFDSLGNMTGMDLPLSINNADQHILQSHLWKIRANRAFILRVYKEVDEKIVALQEAIDRELDE